MDKQKRNAGITLIALVITIIVMLILAGVSLNALVGDNGILKQAQYASFLSEMSAVEEAVQLWKVNQEGNAIPAKCIVQSPEIDKSERIGGEVGYYRVWSTTQTMPSDSIMLDANTFNNKFGGELVYYPGGIEDLYYLDNEGLDLKNNKKYLIDAVNSMVYSVNGIMLNGVRCYSLEMAKAVMSGTYDMPQFAEAEVSGGNKGEKLAGNSRYKKDEYGNYLYDENGNLIENENYNEYGFEIIGDPTNDNIYKLYNNGELYAKGVKGFLLNSQTSEKESLNQYIWKDIQLPYNIPGYNSNNLEISPGAESLFIIDSNRDLWAWGKNDDNVLGLSMEEQIEYTTRNIVKINLFGKKVYKIFPLEYSTFVITKDNGNYELYVAGYNTDGELGIGNTEASQNSFTKVDFINPEKIINITSRTRDGHHTLILTNEGKIYFAGTRSELNFAFKGTNLASTTYITKFTEILNSTYGGNLIDSKVIYLWGSIHYNGKSSFILTEDKKIYKMTSTGIEEQTFNGEKGGVEKFYGSNNFGFIKRKNSSGNLEYWVYCDQDEIYADYGFFGKLNLREWTNINSFLIDNNIDIKNIKDIHYTGNASGGLFILLNNGKIYGMGLNKFLGINKGTTDTNVYSIIDLNSLGNLPNIDEIVNGYFGSNYKELPTLLKSNGKYYTTNNVSLMYRDDILQVNWVKIADNVKIFNASTARNSLAYIDNNNDLWVLGEDSRFLRS